MEDRELINKIADYLAEMEDGPGWLRHDFDQQAKDLIALFLANHWSPIPRG